MIDKTRFWFRDQARRRPCLAPPLWKCGQSLDLRDEILRREWDRCQAQGGEWREKLARFLGVRHEG